MILNDFYLFVHFFKINDLFYNKKKIKASFKSQ